MFLNVYGIWRHLKKLSKYTKAHSIQIATTSSSCKQEYTTHKTNSSWYSQTLKDGDTTHDRLTGKEILPSHINAKTFLGTGRFKLDNWLSPKTYNWNSGQNIPQPDDESATFSWQLIKRKDLYKTKRLLRSVNALVVIGNMSVTLRLLRLLMISTAKSQRQLILPQQPISNEDNEHAARSSQDEELSRWHRYLRTYNSQIVNEISI